MTKYKAARYKKYPAAEDAVRGFLIQEGMPDHLRPAGLNTAMVGYDPREGNEEYSHLADGPTRQPSPSPYEIDMSEIWVKHIEWMYAEGVDRRDWSMFQWYAQGATILTIAGEHDISDVAAGNHLTRIFKTIQEQSDRSAAHAV